jgi:hypothetical protein
LFLPEKKLGSTICCCRDLFHQVYILLYLEVQWSLDIHFAVSLAAPIIHKPLMVCGENEVLLQVRLEIVSLGSKGELVQA